MRIALLCAALSVVLCTVSGCNQHKPQNGQTAQPGNQSVQSGNQAMQSGNQAAGGVERPHLRRDCAADIQKFCQTDERVARCLRQNQANLSSGCQTALQAAIAYRRARRQEMGGQQMNGQQMNGQQMQGQQQMNGQQPINGNGQQQMNTPRQQTPNNTPDDDGDPND